LATAYEQPALGGVYKLTALKQPGESWRHTLKLSEQTAKISIPGLLQVRRYSIPSPNYSGERVRERGKRADSSIDSAAQQDFLADAIIDELTPTTGALTIVDPLDITRQKLIPANT